MISLCVKFKFKLNIYIYLYLCYKKYIQNIIFCIFLLNYFFNLFIILINIFYYFFFNFNKLKFTSLIFKYLIIVKIIDLFLYDIITNKEYYKQYYLYLRQKAKA